jgi:hypothetical protein
MRRENVELKYYQFNTINLCAVFATVRAVAQSGRNLTVTEVLFAASNNLFSQFFTIETTGIHLTHLHITFVFIDEQTDPDHPTIAVYGVTES